VADRGLTAARVRTAHRDDLPRLLELLSELRERATPGVAWEQAEPEAAAGAWDEILADPRRAFLVAEIDGAVVGAADLIVAPNLTHGAKPLAFVENVVVTSAHRGGGIGRALMAEAEARARDAGCYKVQLLSNELREAAHRFYESLGYRASARGYRRYL
jgi:GNAT superfamily N-acetyltransferase